MIILIGYGERQKFFALPSPTRITTFVNGEGAFYPYEIDLLCFISLVDISEFRIFACVKNTWKHILREAVNSCLFDGISVLPFHISFASHYML